MTGIDTSGLIRRLQERNVESVALQFPAGLRRQAHRVVQELKSAGFRVIVSGDPCYGACDLALDAAGMADVLVHFGHSPIDERENILYEPVPWDFDISALRTAIPLLTSTRIGLVTTIQHLHLLPGMVPLLAREGIVAVIAGGGRRGVAPGQILGCCFDAARNTGADEILYVGTGVFHPIGVQLATGARVVAFDPVTGQAEVVSAERLLRKRAVLIERARTARSIGVILSSKSGQRRQDRAARLADLSPDTVLLLMNEVSPDELLNFGFDCYVNTACPRLAYDDQDRFPVPLLTPQEFEIACGVRTWDDYSIDEFCTDAASDT